MGVSPQAFYSLERRYAGVGVRELRELRQLREEKRKLKKLVADLRLTSISSRKCCPKKPEARGAA